ncbi:MAG: hypothetical protein ABI670_22685 [Chloroflexota bacterium]
MSKATDRAKAVAAVIGIGLMAAPMMAASAQKAPTAAPPMADPALQTVWNRTDLPVSQGRVARSWMWGPQPFYSGYEPYLEGLGGQHLITYFDKSRMEINNPGGDRNSQWFVTNGLLVVEMMTGRVQVGNNSFDQITPANVAVAGDPASSLQAPTYASLAPLASLSGNNRAVNRTGQPIVEGVGRNATIGRVDNLGGYAKYGVYEPTLGHNIADVFWTFMNQKGPVFNNGQFVNDTVIDWTFAMGYPITEPYWIPIQVGTEQRWVLMQAFQRRILTYSPFNDPAWRVEMGNVGRAYYDWRYNGTAPVPVTPVATPGVPPAATPTSNPNFQAAIGISPTSGDTNTVITVNGQGFPKNATVGIGVQKLSFNFNRGLGQTSSDGNGNFSTKIKIPADAAKMGEVDIVADASRGSVRAVQTFKLSYNPTITVSPQSVVMNNGQVSVSGEGWPARIGIQLGVLFDGSSNLEIRSNTRSSDDGRFQGVVSIGNRPVGSAFRVYAIGDGGYKAQFDPKLIVIGQPTFRVDPYSGPAGQNVTISGSGWLANQLLTIGIKGANSGSEAFVANRVQIDGNGNFAAQIYIDPAYNNQREVKISATESRSGIRLETTYYLTSAPPPPPATPTVPAPVGNAVVSVNPNIVAVGHVATIDGRGFTPGSIVTLSVQKAGMQETVGRAGTDRNGNFSLQFILSATWTNQASVTLVANDGARLATTGFTVLPPIPPNPVPGGGAIPEVGPPLNITTYRGPTASYVKVDGAGYTPGVNVAVAIVSTDYTVGVRVADTLVKSNGTFSVSFPMAAPWAGRTDLAIGAKEVGGNTMSIRHLPETTMTRAGGNTYQVKGTNWPPNADVVLSLDADGSVNELAGLKTDGNDNFLVNVQLPRIGDKASAKLEVRTPDSRYLASFGF